MSKTSERKKGQSRRMNPRWIPITENQCGDNIFLDLDPDEGGSVGQIVDWWHEQALSKLVSASFDGWLQDIVAALEQGKMQIGA
jgi:cell wall assembly regulator SMI1